MTVNTITITLPVLVLVLGTSDAVHIGFERARQGGRDPVHAPIRATRRVGLACLFAAITTAIAFAALAFSRSALIAEMGRMGMLVTVSASLHGDVHPDGGAGDGGTAAWFRPLYDRLHDHPPSVLRLERLPAWPLPRRARWPGAGWRCSRWRPCSMRRPARAIRCGQPAPAQPGPRGVQRVEQKVAPVARSRCRWSRPTLRWSAPWRRVVAEVTGARAVQSIADIDGGVAAAEADLPAAIARRLISKDGTTTLVSAPFPYENGAQAMALADRLDAALAAEPGLETVEVGRATGLPVMSARVAAVVLDEINRSLLVALVGVGC